MFCLLQIKTMLTFSGDSVCVLICTNLHMEFAHDLYLQYALLVEIFKQNVSILARGSWQTNHLCSVPLLTKTAHSEISIEALWERA